MTTLLLDRSREKPDWLLRALDRATPAAVRDERLRPTRDVITDTTTSSKPPIQPSTLQRSRTTLKSTKDGSRAGNPTPNAGLTKQKPTAPTAGTIDPVLGDKKLAYLQQASDGRVHMIRSGTTVQKPLAVKLSLQRLGTFHDKERDGAWYTQEVRSAPDSTQFASRPWLPQRQHPVSLCRS